MWSAGAPPPNKEHTAGAGPCAWGRTGVDAREHDRPRVADERGAEQLGEGRVAVRHMHPVLGERREHLSSGGSTAREVTTGDRFVREARSSRGRAVGRGRWRPRSGRAPGGRTLPKANKPTLICACGGFAW